MMEVDPTLHWFGRSWGAPVCEEDSHAPTPVGLACSGHSHMHLDRTLSIEADDQGVTMPWVHADGSVSVVAYHLDCWLHELGVPSQQPE